MNHSDLSLPPHSVEAEQSVIGGLLLDANAYDRIADLLLDVDFYRADHRLIYRHIAMLCNAGKPVDTITVAESLENSGELQNVGGLAYVGALAQNTPSAANIRRYAEIVHERAVLRRVQAISADLHSACTNHRGRSPGELVGEAETRLAQAIDHHANMPASLGDTFAEAMAYIDSRGDTGGLETGFRGFDGLTGGLEPGQLMIVAARPSVGKTIFGCNVADFAAKSGRAVMFFTLEMTRREIGMRLLSARSGVSVHAMRSGIKDHDAWSAMSSQMPAASSHRLYVDDTAAVTVAFVRARAKRMRRTHGLDLLVIDYLQLMRGDGQNRTQEVGGISRGLKALAKELGIPIIALAQLNRGVEARTDKRPLLSDLRDSGEVEQDADIVALLHRESIYSNGPEWAGVAELLVRKNRNGPTGDVTLAYRPEQMRFENHYGPAIRQQSAGNGQARKRGLD